MSLRRSNIFATGTIHKTQGRRTQTLANTENIGKPAHRLVPDVPIFFLRPEQNTKHREAGTQAGACAAPMFLQREIETKHREAITLYKRRSDVDNLNNKQNTEMPAHRLHQRDRGPQDNRRLDNQLLSQLH